MEPGTILTKDDWLLTTGWGNGHGHGCNDKLNTQIDYKINDCLWECALRLFGIALRA